MDFESGEVAVRVQTAEMQETISGRIGLRANGWTGDIAKTYHRECIADPSSIADAPEHRRYGVATYGNSSVAHAYDGRVSVCGTAEGRRVGVATKYPTAGKLLDHVECGHCLRVLRSRL